MANEKDNKGSKVLVYGAEWCAPCHATKDYLKGFNVEYEYRNVEEDKKWGEEAVKKSQQFGIPVIDIDGTIIVGFDRTKIDDALSKAGLK